MGTRTTLRTAPAPLKTDRFRNWKLICGELIATAIAVYTFLAWELDGLLGWAGLAAGLLIVWPLSRELPGVAISSKGISFPRRRLGRFPILALGRQFKIGAAGLRELMVMEPWHGFQVVKIEGWFGSELLVFQNRGERLRFMRAFEEICPGVPVSRKKTRANSG